MRVIMFQERFVEAVRSGEKQQTIRVKARCKPGDILSLRRWTGKPYRSKQECILTAVCASVRFFSISERRLVVGDKWGLLTSSFADKEAQADGFKNAVEMKRWFQETHGLPFDAEVISWR